MKQTRSLGQNRGVEGSVHINLSRPLHKVECTSKCQRGFPRGEVLREVCECVSNSGVERSPSLSLGIPGLNLYKMNQFVAA